MKRWLLSGWAFANGIGSYIGYHALDARIADSPKTGLENIALFILAVFFASGIITAAVIQALVHMPNNGSQLRVASAAR